MIQCSDCELFVRGPGGQVSFKCDPFGSIKEPECIAKWQFIKSSELVQKMDRLVTAYEATLSIYRRMQPLQEKMIAHIEREIRESDESDAWKQDEENEPEGGEDKY
ncbi:MAG TPA: hypothetical protein VNT79_05745 [Phycisphaerae bacterium]|nr:hypothetical protein [Phycisphaerae bacterium]